MKDLVQKETLKESVTHLEEEARMVLPGIQALFGFQLIAVFNQRFVEVLSKGEQHLHWVAIGLTTVAILFTLSPASFHRIAEPQRVSQRLVNLSSRWLCLGMLFLMFAICTDFYLVGAILLPKRFISLIFTVVALGGFSFLWFWYPLREKARLDASERHEAA